MKQTIKTLNLISFGKYKQKKYDFSKNLNIIIGDNESGKTTIFEALRTSYCGFIPANKAQNKYVSWDTAFSSVEAEFFDGSIVRRQLTSSIDGYLETNNDIFRIQNNPIYDINRSMFNYFSIIKADDLRYIDEDKLVNLLDKMSNFGIRTPKEAINFIEEKQKEIFLNRKNSKKIINNLDRELDDLNKEIMNNKIKKEKEIYNLYNKEIARIGGFFISDDYDYKKFLDFNFKRIFIFKLSIFLGVISFALLLINFLFVIPCILFFLISLILFFKIKSTGLRNFLLLSLKRINKLKDLTINLSREISINRESELSSYERKRVYFIEKEIEKAVLDYNIYEYLKFIVKSKNKEKADIIIPELMKNASFYFNLFTRDNYTNIYWRNNSFYVECKSGRIINDISYLSEGTISQLYLSIRLAFKDIGGGNSKRPLIFDEAFVYWDYKRKEEFLNTISEISIDRQVFIFTKDIRFSNVYNSNIIKI